MWSTLMLGAHARCGRSDVATLHRRLTCSSRRHLEVFDLREERGGFRPQTQSAAIADDGATGAAIQEKDAVICHVGEAGARACIGE